MASMKNDIRSRLLAWADQLDLRANILARLLRDASDEILKLRQQNEELLRSLGHYEAKDK